MNGWYAGEVGGVGEWENECCVIGVDGESFNQ